MHPLDVDCKACFRFADISTVFNLAYQTCFFLWVAGEDRAATVRSFSSSYLNPRHILHRLNPNIPYCFVSPDPTTVNRKLGGE